MLAVDTNVVVRYITRDDPKQAPRALRLLSDEDTWVGVTVVIETEWVLRSVYRYGSDDVIAAIKSLAGLPRLEIESAAAVDRALGWHQAGMDFADAMHISLAPHCESFATFDGPSLGRATKLGLPVRQP